MARPRGALTLLSRLSRETESPEVVLGSKAIASALAYSLRSRGYIRLTLQNPAKNAGKTRHSRSSPEPLTGVNCFVGFPDCPTSSLVRPGAELSTATLSESLQGNWQVLAVGGRKPAIYVYGGILFGVNLSLIPTPADRLNPSFSANNGFCIGFSPQPASSWRPNLCLNTAPM